MALSTSIPDPQDTEPIAGAYCRIIGETHDYLAGVGKLVIGVWRSKAARDAKLQPVGTFDVDLPAEPVEEVRDGEEVIEPRRESLREVIAENRAAFDAILTSHYERLKRLPVFAEAEDVLEDRDPVNPVEPDPREPTEPTDPVEPIRG